MQIPRSCFRPTESETMGAVSSLCFQMSEGDSERYNLRLTGLQWLYSNLENKETPA